MGSYVHSTGDERRVEERSVIPPMHRADEANVSGVSWGAVIGGAFVTAAVALLLLDLGAGFGFLSTSPWANEGASVKTIGVLAIIWMFVVEILASALGGYMVGRLRTKWAAIHSDEVFFRDTANGLIMWCLAFVATIAFLSMGTTVMASSAAAGATTGLSQGSAGTVAPAGNYYVDSMFRGSRAANAADLSASNAEAGRIFAMALAPGGLSSPDRQQLDRMIAERTGVTQTEADQRVNDTVTQAKQATDTARKATAYGLLWMFICMLAGAFFASWFATIGGRIRDHVKAA
jgi:hypothetical protein